MVAPIARTRFRNLLGLTVAGRTELGALHEVAGGDDPYAPAALINNGGRVKTSVQEQMAYFRHRCRSRNGDGNACHHIADTQRQNSIKHDIHLETYSLRGALANPSIIRLRVIQTLHLA